ncbi:hypothetical protein Misp06_00967 [Microbulbifer sp. NBRC 101763]|uniref:DUF6488 family protein n=1 Tax=Microbulbifer TaxID=48073 RepID=UPI0003788531|nr:MULTISPECIES: DUF6488 family protein [Microbulbifer]WHI49288.1 DUF6488 family protein [Microbulbifer sp. MLAF003]
MNKLIRVICVSVTLGFANLAFAHGDHERDNFATVSMVEAKGIASQEVARLIKEGKLNESWSGKPLNAAMQRVDNQRQWVVSTQGKDGGLDKILKVFLSTEGYFLSFKVTDR